MQEKRDLLDEAVDSMKLFEEYGKQEVIEEGKYSKLISDAISNAKGLAKDIETHIKVDDKYAKSKDISFVESLVKELENLSKAIKKHSMSK